MKRSHLQNGFAGLELLLILAVILTLGGIASYVYSKNRSHNSSATTAEQTAATPEGTSTSPNGIPGGTSPSTATSQPAANQNIIKISSVGLQMTVPDSLKDLTYQLTNTGSGTLIAFSSQRLTAAIPSCAANNGSGAFDTITRGNGTYPGPANPSSGGLLKQYSSYYFAYTLPNGPCAKGLSVENQNLLNALSQDFYGSLGSVQAL